MIETSRVQKLLLDQNAEINRLRGRIEKLEAALQRIRNMHEDGGIDNLEERDDRTYVIVYNALEGKENE
jgi:hypothetical protein